MMNLLFIYFIFYLSLHPDICLAFLLLGSEMIKYMHLHKVVYRYLLLFKMNHIVGSLVVSFPFDPVFDSNGCPEFVKAPLAYILTPKLIWNAVCNRLKKEHGERAWRS